MSKIGNWLKPNWYNDAGWPKAPVLALLRRDWKHRRKIANQHAANERIARRRRSEALQVFVMSSEAAQLEFDARNRSFKGKPPSSVNYPYRGRGQAPSE